MSRSKMPFLGQRSFLVGSIAVVALTSCTSVTSERRRSGRVVPEFVGDRWTGVKHDRGYVVRLEFFTRAEMKSSEWEFARAKSSAAWMCSGHEQLIYRDVRWFEPTPSSGQRCARVIYTIKCTPHEAFTSEEWRQVSEKDFAEVRQKLLDDPPSDAIPKGCHPLPKDSQAAN